MLHYTLYVNFRMGLKISSIERIFSPSNPHVKHRTKKSFDFFDDSSFTQWLVDDTARGAVSSPPLVFLSLGIGHDAPQRSRFIDWLGQVPVPVASQLRIISETQTEERRVICVVGREANSSTMDVRNL